VDPKKRKIVISTILQTGSYDETWQNSLSKSCWTGNMYFL